MPFFRSWAAFSVIALVQLFRRHTLLVLGSVAATQVLEQAWIGMIHEQLVRRALTFPLGLLLWFLVMNGFVLVLILALDDANAARPVPPLRVRIAERVGSYYLELLKLVPLVLLGLVLVVIPGLVMLVRWSMVPFVVLLEPRSKAGPWATARRAQHLTRSRIGAITALLAAWLVAAGTLRRFVLPRHQFFLNDLPAYALNVVVDYLFAIVLFTALYTLYRHLKLDEAPGADAAAADAGSAPAAPAAGPGADA